MSNETEEQRDKNPRKGRHLVNRGWGTVADELLFHTSRYYAYAQAFIRHLSGDGGFTLDDY